MNFLSELTLGDIFQYIVYPLVGGLALFLAWKIGKGGYRLTKLIENSPAKTAGILGMITALFGTPIVYTKLIDSDPGVAYGGTLAGGFIALLSAVTLLRKNRQVAPGQGLDLSRDPLRDLQKALAAEGAASLKEKKSEILDADRKLALANLVSNLTSYTKSRDRRQLAKAGEALDNLRKLL